MRGHIHCSLCPAERLSLHPPAAASRREGLHTHTVVHLTQAFPCRRPWGRGLHSHRRVGVPQGATRGAAAALPAGGRLRLPAGSASLTLLAPGAADPVFWCRKSSDAKVVSRKHHCGFQFHLHSGVSARQRSERSYRDVQSGNWLPKVLASMFDTNVLDVRIVLQRLLRCTNGLANSNAWCVIGQCARSERAAGVGYARGPVARLPYLHRAAGLRGELLRHGCWGQHMSD